VATRYHKLYAKTGRPSIAPEKLLRALLLQALYSVRSERLLMEQLDYNLLFRWFVGLNMDDSVWDVTVFTKNRERLLDGDIAEAFFQAVLQQARERSLLSDEHFTVDGTLLEAWASAIRKRRVAVFLLASNGQDERAKGGMGYISASHPRGSKGQRNHAAELSENCERKATRRSPCSV
jgi:transposase